MIIKHYSYFNVYHFFRKILIFLVKLVFFELNMIQNNSIVSNNDVIVIRIDNQPVIITYLAQN